MGYSYEDLAFPGEAYEQKFRELRAAYQPRHKETETDEPKKKRTLDVRALVAALFVW